ncbi:hypothetical protein KUCAC02_002665, partial [Chaenocephalus aceratus]
RAKSSLASSPEAELSMVSEDRLVDELKKQKVSTGRKLCMACHLDSKGSRDDLVNRLREEMKTRHGYDKIFQKIWGASCGWSVILCPRGVVYSLKFNLRAESPGDFTDLLLSWKHLPNASMYDFARGLATHANLRFPASRPFKPHEGRLAASSHDDIAAAQNNKRKVSLPWMDIRSLVPQTTMCGMINSTNDPQEVLRRINLVPELQGWLNSQDTHKLKRLYSSNSQQLEPLCSNKGFVQTKVMSHVEHFVKTSPHGTKYKLTYVLDTERPEAELIVRTGNSYLTRGDFWTLGLTNEMESTIGNACFELIERIAQSKGRTFVLLIRMLCQHGDTQLYATHSQLYLMMLPVWKPGHFLLALLKPTQRDSLSGFLMCTCTIWIWQLYGNDCGIFMLMGGYLIDAPYDFTITDMPALRKWWCVMLMDNFDLGSHGKMFAHWTETSKALLRGEVPPVFRPTSKIVQDCKKAAEWVVAHKPSCTR